MEKQEYIEKILNEIINDLGKKSRNLIIIGSILTAISVALGYFLFIDIKETTILHLKELNAAKDTTATVIYLSVRSSALGSIAVAFLYFAFKITNSNFDQSMRFVKRKMAAMYLKMLYKTYGVNIKDKVSMNEIMESFYIWNLNVESAFTPSHKDEVKHDTFIPNVIFKRKNTEEVNVNPKDKEKG